MTAERSLVPWLLASMVLHMGVIGLAAVRVPSAGLSRAPALLLRIEQLGRRPAASRPAASLQPALASGGRAQVRTGEGLQDKASVARGGESGADPRSVPDRSRELAARARGSYEQLLAARLERYKRYPDAATRRRLEGDALLRLSLARDGKVVGRAIVTPSRSEILDRAALAMVDRAAPFPALPEELAGERFDFEIPVSFQLD